MDSDPDAEHPLLGVPEPALHPWADVPGVREVAASAE